MDNVKYSYERYSQSIKDLCILVDMKTNIAYINPDYKNKLIQMNLDVDKCEIDLTWEDVYHILECEVKIWNSKESKIGIFISELSELLHEGLINTFTDLLMDQRKERLEKEAILRDINSVTD